MLFVTKRGPAAGSLSLAFIVYLSISLFGFGGALYVFVCMTFRVLNCSSGSNYPAVACLGISAKTLCGKVTLLQELR